MRARKLEGRELVMIVRATGRRQWLIADRVVAGISRSVICFRGPADFAVTVEIQTKLQTARMKGAAPVKIARRFEIVPLNRDAHRVDVAVKRTPTLFDFAPGTLFGSALRIHRDQITNACSSNARSVSFPRARPGPTPPGPRPRRRCSGRTRAEDHPAISRSERRRRAK